jgi:hypothetical protein
VTGVVHSDFVTYLYLTQRNIGYVEPVNKQQKQRRGLLPKAIRFARASGIVK